MKIFYIETNKIKAPQYIIEEDEKHIVKIYRFIPEDTET